MKKARSESSSSLSDTSFGSVFGSFSKQSRRNAPSTPILLAAILCVLLTLLLWWPIPFYSSAVGTSNFNSLNMSPAFSLLVTLTFDEESSKSEFKSLFQPLAAYVEANEPNTIAYQLLESDTESLQVLLLERYRDKQVDYLQTHKSSAVFLEFRAKLAAMQEAGRVTVQGHSYADSGVGYIRS